MIDRFRFRAWLKDKKKYDYDIEDCFEDWIFENFGQYLKDEDVIVEQCTGAKDKNGKLVYEGDIIKTPNGAIGYIVWSQQDLAFYTKDLIPKEKEAYLVECEVIGNIHENVDLLENEE